MARRLFGTDGVRGVAGEFLTADLALSLARAATARVQRPSRPPARVLVIRDTRESGEMLEAAVAAGIAAAGGEALLGGVLPTPGAPLLIGRYGLDLGVVISASHNPYRDNGIKFFGGDGFKLSDETETAIEEALDEPVASTGRIGSVRRLHGALEDYLRGLHERFAGLDLQGRTILLDCANGATYRAAPEIFRRLGAEVEVLAAAPDGQNINDGCGSTHVERLADTMTKGGHDVGFAFDGDGDRMLAIDRAGRRRRRRRADRARRAAPARGRPPARPRRRRDGDDQLRLPHRDARRAGSRSPPRRSATATCSRPCASAAGRSAASSPATSSTWASCRPATASPPSLLTLEALGGADLADRHGMEKLPQKLVNVRMADRGALAAATAAAREAIEREAAALEGRGRVLVRPSGTEPLVRVMVEAPTAQEADDDVRAARRGGRELGLTA